MSLNDYAICTPGRQCWILTSSLTVPVHAMLSIRLQISKIIRVHMQWGHHSLVSYSATWATQRGSSTHQITLDAVQVDSLRGGRNITLNVLLLCLIQKHSIHAYDSAICTSCFSSNKAMLC